MQIDTRWIQRCQSSFTVRVAHQMENGLMLPVMLFDGIDIFNITMLQLIGKMYSQICGIMAQRNMQTKAVFFFLRSDIMDNTINPGR